MFKRRCVQVKKSKPKKINGHIAKNGYRTVVVSIDEKPYRRKRFYIHRLVAEHFIENPNNYKFVNHIDGNKLNNHVSNLEWCTPSHNNQHAYNIGLKPRGEEFYSAKLTEEDVLKIKEMLSRGVHPKNIAPIYSVSVSAIKQIKNGYTWKHLDDR